MRSVSRRTQRLMGAKIEMKSQLYSVGHYVLKSSGADFRGNGKLNFSTESLIFQNKNAIGNLKRDMLVVFWQKSHLNFGISTVSRRTQRLMSAKIELKSQLYSVGHSVLKSTDADFRVMENGMTNFWKQKRNLKFRKRHVGGWRKKKHAYTLRSVSRWTQRLMHDERKNRAEMSNIFIRPLSAEIDRGWFWG